MRLHRTATDDSGYTLIELLAYAFVLAIIVNTSVALFLNAKRLSALGEMAFDRISGVEEIGREFRDAVMHSDGISPELDAIKTDENCLVLTKSGAEGRRYVVIRADSKGQHLRLEEYSREGKELWLERLKTFALPVAGVRFQYGSDRPEESRTVQLHLEIDNKGTPNTTPSENVFIASLRGWRG